MAISNRCALWLKPSRGETQRAIDRERSKTSSQPIREERVSPTAPGVKGHRSWSRSEGPRAWSLDTVINPEAQRKPSFTTITRVSNYIQSPALHWHVLFSVYDYKQWLYPFNTNRSRHCLHDLPLKLLQNAHKQSIK